MQKQVLSLLVNIISTLLMVFPSSPVLAVSDPIVVEVFREDYSPSNVYTVINPEDSSVGDIVGLVIEVDYDWTLYADTTNGWLAQGETPVNSTTWDLNMSATGLPSSALTWRQFFGGIDYPFGDVDCAGYFVNYSEVAPDTFKFDWSYPADPYHLPVLAGETLDGFNAYLDAPCSQFLLAHIGDAENGTFSDDGLPSFMGETIPEPATITMLGLGGVALLRKRRV